MEKVFYHGTSKAKAENIMRDGFQLNAGRFGDAIYLAPTKEYAERFGEVVLTVTLNIPTPHEEQYEVLALRYPGTSIEEEEGITELASYIVDSLGQPAVHIKYHSGDSELCVYEPNIIKDIKLYGEEKLYLIRDEKGEVFNRVKTPTVVFDGKDAVLYKIGEKEAMEDYYELCQKRYRSSGFHSMADDLVLMDIPKDQETIDKVFQITGYIGVLYKQVVQKEGA